MQRLEFEVEHDLWNCRSRFQYRANLVERRSPNVLRVPARRLLPRAISRASIDPERSRLSETSSYATNVAGSSVFLKRDPRSRPVASPNLIRADSISGFDRLGIKF